MDKAKKLPCWVKVVAAIFALIFVFNWPSSSSDWAAWVAAVGTVLAVAVALFFSLADARERAQERLRTNSVYQWLFVPDIGQALPAANSIIDFIDGVEREENGYRIPDSELDYLDVLCDSIQVPNINAHIDALVHFDPDFGRLLARIASNGAFVAYRLRTIRKKPIVSDQMKKYLESQRVLLEELNESIQNTHWFKG